MDAAVERSTFAQDAVVHAIAQTAEECCAKVNQLLDEVLQAKIESAQDKRDCLRNLRKRMDRPHGRIARCPWVGVV